MENRMPFDAHRLSGAYCIAKKPDGRLPAFFGKLPRQQAVNCLASDTTLSYRMGELALWKLRREGEESLGEQFDIEPFTTLC